MSGPNAKRPPRIGNLEHISTILDALLDDLGLGSEQAFGQRGGFRRRVRREQDGDLHDVVVGEKQA